MTRTLLAAMLLATACAGRAGTPAGGPAAQTEADGLNAPRLRLPDTVVPRRQSVRLRVTAADPAFSGESQIDVEVRVPTNVIWLHADGLVVDRAELAGGGAAVPLRPVRKETTLGLVAAAPLPAGPARLTIGFHGTMPSSREDRGVYREQERGRWYVFTQFEAVDARRAFPCFDEPSFKIPWKLALDVPAGERAFANTPQSGESALDGGWKRVEFAETRPLPSYLVAFAVGPFEVVDAGTGGRKGTAIRLVVPAGGSPEAAFAAKTTGEVVKRLEDYFGIPYPYDKLDEVAVPQKGGAMENPGLVTYGTNIILGKPGERNIRLERGYLGIAAHELGHMWFGDLVTTGWWDDIWLNEAFASWISDKIITGWHPEWGGEVGKVQSRNGVMQADALASARRIRQPIVSSHDIENAFDGITYQKGEAVIGMFEAYLGPDRFRAGVRRYLEGHAYGNASARDFLAAISEPGGRDPVPAAFSTFLDQPGFPLLTVALDCQRGRTARLRIAQERYRPRGSSATAQRWQVPVCARYPEGRSCTLVSDERGELELAGTDACPAWVLPNAGAVGYYRVKYQGDLLRQLLAGGGHQLTVAERLSVLGDVSALVDTADLPYEQALDLVPGLASDDSRFIVGAALRLAGSISDDYVPDELRPNYVRFVRKTFGARARKLGWDAHENDDDDVRLLRAQLVPSFADRAEDGGLVASARVEAERWLADRKAVSPELVGPVLSTAAAHGDRALWTKLYDAARREKDRRDRQRMLGAMGAFRDPTLINENFKLAMSDQFDPRESLTLLFGAVGYRGTRQMAYDFIKANYDRITGRLPPQYASALASVSGAFCDPEHRADAERFFSKRVEKAAGGPRNLAHTLEGVDLCIAGKAAQQPSVIAFLRKQ
jgi:alanyl aminopeptidase